MSVPTLSREQLLDFSYLKNYFDTVSDNDIYKVLDGLRQQAKELKISSRDFEKLLKAVQSSQPAIIQSDNSLIPEEIRTIGDEYYIDNQGIHLQQGRFIIDVCPHPIFPIEILKDIDTGYEKVRIAYYRYGKWNKDIILDRQDVATNKGIIKLANYGILVNDANASYLVKYFCDIEKLNEDRLTIQYASQTLGYSQYGFIPYTSDITYSGTNPENKRRFNLYHEHGDFEIWRQKQIECMSYSVPKILIAGAYASLLIDKIGINPFGIHLWGETGMGKSVALLTSASVYGYPDIKDGIVYTGNATNNGLEPRLAFNKNCAFFLDELSMLSPKQIDDMIYLIMQGQGKARMDKQGNTKNTYYWNLVSISNAEMPITNDLSKGGTYNRIYQIGIKGKVFGDMKLTEIADTFKNNYGFGAKLFIELLEKDGIDEEIANLKKAFYNEIIGYTEDKQANAAACIMTAYELIRKYIYHTDKTLTTQEILQYISTPDEISQVLRVYTKLGDWIEANYHMFDDTELPNSQSKWGSITNGMKVINILPYKFSEFCNKVAMINERQFLTGLKQHDLINTLKNELKNSAKVDNRTVRVVSVKKLWVAPITLDQLEEVKTEGELPF